MIDFSLKFCGAWSGANYICIRVGFDNAYAGMFMRRNAFRVLVSLVLTIVLILVGLTFFPEIMFEINQRIPVVFLFFVIILVVVYVADEVNLSKGGQKNQVPATD